MPPLDTHELRRVLGLFPTGVALVTAPDEHGAPVGMIVGSFCSVSLDPPLVAFMPARDSYRYSRFARAERFCVNSLATSQEDLCREVLTDGGLDRIEADWITTVAGSWALTEAAAWLDCSVESRHEFGDHYFVLGRVEAMSIATGETPLVFWQGSVRAAADLAAALQTSSYRERRATQWGAASLSPVERWEE